jgi:hypothetical protein
MENVSRQSLKRKSKHAILCSIKFFLFEKSCLLLEDVIRFCKAGQATDTHSEYVMFVAFSAATAVARREPQCRVINKFLFLYYVILYSSVHFVYFSSTFHNYEYISKLILQ